MKYSLYNSETGQYLDSSKIVIPKPNLDVTKLSVEEMVTLHAQLLRELPFFPRGTLAVRRRGRRKYFSVQTTVNHVRQDRYLSPNRNANLIKMLQQKRIIRSTLRKIRKAARHLKGYRRRLAAKQAVIDRPHAEHYVFYTNKIYVQSTAEAAIVEMLHKRHVKFKYGQSTSFKGRIYFPDFTYIVDGRSVFHEHLGMLDRPSYVRDWKRKHSWYRRCGLVDGFNLLTSELHDTHIDLVEIEQMLHARGVF